MEHHCHQHSVENGKEGRLIISIVLNFIITAVQVVGGMVSGSLALLSDALHNFSDAISLVVSYIAVRLSKRVNTETNTFGYKRAEILAALFNAATLIIVSFFLFKEAAHRFSNPASVDSILMIVVAGVGLAANVGSAILLKNDAHDDMNMRSAYFHLFSDALSSVAVMAGGLCILLFRAYWIDPVLTILIGLYVLKGGFDLIGESVHILMQNTPKGVDVKAIQNAIDQVDGVKGIHHVHVWAVTELDIHFEAHVNLKKDLRLSESGVVKDQIEALLKSSFKIGHATLQFEYEGCPEDGLIKVQ